MKPRHFFLAASSLICLSAGACKSKDDNAPPAAANTGTPGVPTVSTDTGAAKSVTGADTGAATAVTAMTDADILARAHGGDSAEIAIAKYVRAQSTNSAVKAYAALLESDHGKGMSKVEGVAKTLGLQMTPPPNDTTAQGTQHTVDHLKSLKGRDLDTAFVNHEVADHQHDIDEAKAMATAAKQPDVKKLVEDELPELKKHLDKAQALQSQLRAKK